ncbi:MAG: hypothetical protein ACI9CV_000190 [Ilumatobacter sp.]|jgi:hypothetical protein
MPVPPGLRFDTNDSELCPCIWIGLRGIYGQPERLAEAHTPGELTR